MAKTRTPASNAAQYRYNAAKIKRVPLDMQKSYYENELKPAADSVGESVNGFIKTAIAERIERISKPEKPPEQPEPIEETVRAPIEYWA